MAVKKATIAPAPTQPLQMRSFVNNRSSHPVLSPPNNFADLCHRNILYARIAPFPFFPRKKGDHWFHWSFVVFEVFFDDTATGSHLSLFSSLSHVLPVIFNEHQCSSVATSFYDCYYRLPCMVSGIELSLSLTSSKRLSLYWQKLCVFPKVVIVLIF
jgi:hypothetical protein